MLDAARDGRSAALIIFGAPGVGKTSLLEQAAATASDFTILRVNPMEAEAELPFAGLADLVRPIVHLLGQIPSPQQAALSVRWRLARLSLGTALPWRRQR